MALTLVVVALAGCDVWRTDEPSKKKKQHGAPKAARLEATPFGELNGADVYNASGVVEIGPGRFLFCDNNDAGALFELRLDENGVAHEPIVRRPLVVLDGAAFADLEDLAAVESRGRRFVVATSSMFVRRAKKREPPEVPPSGLVRISEGADGTLTAEVMSDFRDWLVASSDAVAAAADREPDDGGLNVEGLAWDDTRSALLVGLRTPDLEGRPAILPVRVRDIAGSWSVASLELLAPVRLDIKGKDVGIRGLARDPVRGGFLVLVGNAKSGSKTDFELYRWDGGPTGDVTRIPLAFDDKMKPEGIARATVGGLPALLVVDDGGGYLVVRDDEIEE